MLRPYRTEFREFDLFNTKANENIGMISGFIVHKGFAPFSSFKEDELDAETRRFTLLDPNANYSPTNAVGFGNIIDEDKIKDFLHTWDSGAEVGAFRQDIRPERDGDRQQNRTVVPKAQHRDHIQRQVSACGLHQQPKRSNHPTRVYTWNSEPERSVQALEEQLSDRQSRFVPAGKGPAQARTAMAEMPEREAKQGSSKEPQGPREGLDRSKHSRADWTREDRAKYVK